MSYTITASLVDSDGTSSSSRSTIEPSGGRIASNRLSLVATTEVDVDHSSGVFTLSSMHTLLVINRSTADTIEFGLSTGVYITELAPGQANIYTFAAGTTPQFFAKSKETATTASQLDYEMREH